MSIGATQLHATLVGFSPSELEKVKVALAGQTVFGIAMVTYASPGHFGKDAALSAQAVFLADTPVCLYPGTNA